MEALSVTKITSYGKIQLREKEQEDLSLSAQYDKLIQEAQDPTIKNSPQKRADAHLALARFEREHYGPASAIPSYGKAIRIAKQMTEDPWPTMKQAHIEFIKCLWCASPETKKLAYDTLIALSNEGDEWVTELLSTKGVEYINKYINEYIFIDHKAAKSFFANPSTGNKEMQDALACLQTLSGKGYGKASYRLGYLYLRYSDDKNLGYDHLGKAINLGCQLTHDEKMEVRYLFQKHHPTTIEQAKICYEFAHVPGKIGNQELCLHLGVCIRTCTDLIKTDPANKNEYLYLIYQSTLGLEHAKEDVKEIIGLLRHLSDQGMGLASYKLCLMAINPKYARLRLDNGDVFAGCDQANTYLNLAIKQGYVATTEDTLIRLSLLKAYQGESDGWDLDIVSTYIDLAKATLDSDPKKSSAYLHSASQIIKQHRQIGNKYFASGEVSKAVETLKADVRIRLSDSETTTA